MVIILCLYLVHELNSSGQEKCHMRTKSCVPGAFQLMKTASESFSRLWLSEHFATEKGLEWNKSSLTGNNLNLKSIACVGQKRCRLTCIEWKIIQTSFISIYCNYFCWLNPHVVENSGTIGTSEVSKQRVDLGGN